MSTNTQDEVSLVSKMKVAELKKELKAKGLSTAGTKTELVERLQSASSISSQELMLEEGNADAEMLDEDEVLEGVEGTGEFDDDDLTAEAVLADEPKTEPPVKPPTIAVKRPAQLGVETTAQESQPKKRVLIRPISVSTSNEKENGAQEKITTKEVDKETTAQTAEGKKIVKLSGVSVKERLELRAQKFGVPLSEAAKKEARAARFGIGSGLASSEPSKISTITTAKKVIVVGPNADVLKKRAERFGGNVSSLAQEVEEYEKLKKRQERFGVSAATTVSLDEKKKLRAQRFKL